MYKTVLLILQITYYTHSEDLKDLSAPALIKLGQDVSVLHPYEAHPSDVQFYLTTRGDTPEARLVTPDTPIDNTLKSKFIVHGWLENHRRSWCEAIAEQFLANEDCNVFIVDWEKPARTAYATSAKNTKIVGYEVANFIMESKLSGQDVHLIGHSLGAHVAGFTGKKLLERFDQKVQRISGLDPAGPYFRLPGINSTERLDKLDAEVVDIIHTDAGFYEYENPLGTLDVYVNGGQRVQPGCLDEFIIIGPTSLGDIFEKYHLHLDKLSAFCSHSRSTKYFVEWQKGSKFKCIFCQPVLGINLFGDKCTLHHTDQLVGFGDVTEGICFAPTNPQEPYLS
ncbi:pancreatic triacylglycerol lipase-like [Anthonomus grandis grandis]|uniref:pancreatic triacylglycerol lipase-like n=1 Tax=Anthonomus grandis grandis TaxID=2921223 RepID=UPI002165D85C|nr:pancreatic triacylglycerol lipase-like [Anthonomus grandis grandis]